MFSKRNKVIMWILGVAVLVICIVLIIQQTTMDDQTVESATDLESNDTNNDATSEGGPADPSIQTDIPSLSETFVDYFPIGAAIEPFQTDGLTADLLEKHVNMLVAENVMKPDALQPTEGNFRWENADQIVEFANEHDMQLRFHTLVWHNQIADWFFMDEDGQPMVDETDEDKREENKQLLLERLDTHVRTIVERYKDDIAYWDVVNEVIEPGDPDGMRDTPWYQLTGTKYIETAFHAAREAGGEDINLYINDYSTADPTKRDLLYELVEEMLDRGVPIDGVGHQTHLNIREPSIDSVITSIEMFHGLGLDNQVTELDMSLYTWNDRSDHGDNIPEDLLLTQAERYRDLFEAFRENQDKISAVVFWGIADNHTWLHDFPEQGRTDAPLPFDQQFQAKPAFWGIVDPSKLHGD